MFADVVSRAFAKSTVEQRPELNLVHVNLIKTNYTQTKPVQIQTQCGLQLPELPQRMGSCRKYLKLYSRSLEAAYLQCQFVNSVGLVMTRGVFKVAN